MAPTSKQELLSTIQSIPSDKAAGYDGIDINLIKMLIEDDGPLVEILLTLINVALEHGQSLPSWRKAVITMTPKRKEDGSWTIRSET